MAYDAALRKAVDILQNSSSVVAFTGAGISSEAGIPTFRGSGGLWERFRPEELATPEAFERDPERVWRWYAWRIGIVLSAEPTLAHRILARWEDEELLAGVITQNVDGLHQRAGSRRVVELHGRITRARCTGCGRSVELEAPPEEVPPRCGACGSLLRPDVVWFGESLPEDAWREAVELSSSCDAMLVIGTSAVVYPAAQLPLIAKAAGAKLIEVNPEETVLSRRVDAPLRMGASEALSALDEILGG